MLVAGKLPGPFAPHVGRAGGDALGKVGAIQAGERPGPGQRLLRRDLRASGDAAVLGALVAEQSGQAASIDFGDGDQAFSLRIIGQAHA